MKKCLLLLTLLFGAALASAQPPQVETIADAPGLENLHRLRPWLYVGGEPQSAPAFARLAALGVKTIISVDGAKPDLAEAGAHGLRYVHVPIGYDGIPSDAAAALAKALDTRERPFYIHCHHGRHRGPAMAAAALRIEEALGPEAAAALMHAVGTASSYEGLYRDVAALDPATLEAKNAELFETAPVPGFTAHMAEIDRIFARLEMLSKNNFAPMPEHPDLSPPHEALLMQEALAESLRAERAQWTPEFVALYEASLAAATQLRNALVARAPDHATSGFKALSASCKDCHSAYRNADADWYTR